MRIPSEISDLYQHEGPFATVYLDATRSSESGAREVELRWRGLHDELAGADADAATLDALGAAAVSGHRGVPGPHGQVLVAAHGQLLADLTLPQPPVRMLARWAPLPHVMPYLAQLAPPVPHVLVLTDRTGADLLTVDARASAHAASGLHTVVPGAQGYPIHKTATSDWSERHFQQRVENSWADNARTVAEQVRAQVARIGARFVVTAGDPQARALLGTDLAEVLGRDVSVVDVRPGGRAAGASRDALDNAVRDVLLRQLWSDRGRVLAALRQALSRGDYAVSGVDGVLAALRRAQVDTLVLSDDPSSVARAWIGPECHQIAAGAEELHELGVSDPARDRLDAAIVRALAGSDADLLVTPNAHDYVADGVAALLRYTDAATSSGAGGRIARHAKRA